MYTPVDADLALVVSDAMATSGNGMAGLYHLLNWVILFGCQIESPKVVKSTTLRLPPKYVYLILTIECYPGTRTGTRNALQI